VIPNTQAALWPTLAVTAFALAICLPAAAAIISGAATPEGQGGALGTNQSMQVGAEAIAGLFGGVLAAIATALPLSTMAALALVASAALWMTPPTG
jgi:hypothetical protein